ncbi:MAG: potassium transporter Kup [Ignavibacteria bacterium RIFOXYB2_FULL_35_12]|nr:MAG: potassium transporter Kup [Ignavibacteria bacterium GWA2_36_19]OGU51681.1 MAG: potassium transporter Kup [Ignavibacteria bacterium GWC2_35_8]OGU58005.1 MAG: potassium transporter Kup [Ignavibacteria bacterium GWF2_35_20]OGU80865.1 MAG: potassium transporter Kup [Ignavibacteria bacterium RIFOXYA2_FULL_35_9]OGU90534.1 MAG: potassium transporter Kup [Ignavibacteria bacterium RIFOXYC12_FULL_35_11]OGU91955.1 MAG: potassium transporter Kup [Ignavibacteria bacterium RIFOXYA12_FULL_35_25]OGU9
MAEKHTSFSILDNIKAMGLVFGDIGTSPIYTLTVIFTLTSPTIQNVMGVLSLIFWALIVLVTVEYSWLAMSLSTKGEGGIIVLKEILSSKVKKGRRSLFAVYLGYLGVSLLMGDGVITPAISILSAVEGLKLFPGLGNISLETILLITCAITIILFAFQHKGSDKVSSSFGPIMILWFLALFTSGMFYIFKIPSVLMAVSPHYAIDFMLHNGLPGFFILSEVILCATGGEALYADMGHLGAIPIRQAWYLVFVALVINYFGQGAYLQLYGKSEFILFEMVHKVSDILYILFIILALFATIIASQAMISAVMSLVYQGITTRIFPLMKIKYTSTHLKSQIYIGAVNWMLLVAVIIMIFLFKKSENLAAAYGLAVTATMTISAIFMIWIFKVSNIKIKFYAAIFVLIIDLLFLLAVFTKIPHGGYWSLIIASIPFFVIMLWTVGNKNLQIAFRSLSIDTFLESYNQIYSLGNNIKGTALFLTKNLERVPPYVVHCMLRTSIMYEENIFISISTSDYPYGIDVTKVEEIAPGLKGLIISCGYMEYLDIPGVLKNAGINEKVIFYGIEEISARRPFLRLYAFLKKITPHFVAFYKLNYRKLHGVATRIEF